MATYSSILAWRIPWKEDPGGLQSMCLQRVSTTEVTRHTHLECVPKLSRYQDLVAPRGHL